MRLKFGIGFRGRIHITEVNALNNLISTFLFSFIWATFTRSLFWLFSNYWVNFNLLFFFLNLMHRSTILVFWRIHLVTSELAKQCLRGLLLRLVNLIIKKVSCGICLSNQKCLKVE